MKLLIASGIYPPDIGGPATYSQIIAREFSKKGIDVSVICYSDVGCDVGRATSHIEQFLIVRILRKNKLFRYLSYFWNLFKLAKNCDIIYAQGPLAAGLPAMLVSKILRKKFIIKIVGDYAWEQGVNQFGIKDLIEEFQNKKYCAKVERIRKIQKKVCKSANKIIVPSEFLKKIVKRWGIDEKKIIVIHNAFTWIQNTKYKIQNTKLDGDVIISAGRPEPWKGYNALNEIMPDLLKENPEFKLIIATKLPHNELMEHFKASKIFVLNSGYEGFSHMLLEAMACGLPIVTTNVCGNPEIIQNRENGLLIEYNNKEQIKNAILEIWKNKDLREKLINNGHKTLEKFGLEKMINETIKVLMSVQGGSASGRKLLMIAVGRILAQGKKGPFYYLLEEFSKYWDRIDVICPRIEQGDYNIHKNVYIHGFPKLMQRQPWFIFKKGLEIYRKEKFDLFTIHNDPPFYNDIGGYWLHKRTKVPYVLEVMHIIGHPKVSSFKEWFYKLLERLFVNFFAKNAKAVRIINKKQTGEFLKKSGVDEKKLKYIPAFYIDFDVFKPQSLASGGTEPEKKYDVVFSGRLVKNKGIDLLLKAIRKLKVKSQKLKLIIIGDGPLKSRIKKFIKKNHLENNIELVGWLPTINDLAKIYNQSKIMVMPSYNEGGPRVTLEAMACKIPVITSRVGVMLDIIKEGENGLFIDWNPEDIADKIMLLLKNDDLRLKIAESGYQTVQQFERKKLIENYAQTYQNLLHSTRL